MSVVFSLGRGVAVRLRGVGGFFCLQCEEPREYERREWRSRRMWANLVPAEARWREFILCRTCDSTFRVECLDESSEAFAEELTIDVPDSAIFTSLRSGHQIPRQRSASSSATIEYETREAGPDDPRRGPTEEIRFTPRPNALVAYSSARRH
ncbi:MAG TPA: hypothetical protein VGX23_07140 [Actinocrinis sp.]|nr:hypothetical protein [Actinocrinis sp.]